VNTWVQETAACASLSYERIRLFNSEMLLDGVDRKHLQDCAPASEDLSNRLIPGAPLRIFDLGLLF